MVHIKNEAPQPMPVKEQIRRWIEAEVRAGRILTGAAVPSINALAKTFGASRESVRLALDGMVRRGQLQARQGKGFFVAPPRERGLTVGILGRLDGVYMRPIHAGLMQAFHGQLAVIFFDLPPTAEAMRTTLEQLAGRQMVDCLLVVPPRGQEAAMDALLAPFKRFFRLAWIDRAPAECSDARFLCDYARCVAMAKEQFAARAISDCAYYSRHPEDNSVFTCMRRAWGGRLFSDWQQVVSWVSRSSQPCGLLAETDREAVHILSQLQHNGIRVPDKLSLISGDDSELTELVQPAISAINPGFDELGRAAASWLEAMAAGEAVRPPAFVATPVMINKGSCLGVQHHA